MIDPNALTREVIGKAMLQAADDLTEDNWCRKVYFREPSGESTSQRQNACKSCAAGRVAIILDCGPVTAQTKMEDFFYFDTFRHNDGCRNVEEVKEALRRLVNG